MVKAASRLRCFGLPRGCYLIHHVILLFAGALGLTGFLSPVLRLSLGFGYAVSVGLLLSGAMGVFARIWDQFDMEIVALRMMSILSVVWGFGVFYAVSLDESDNIMGGLVLVAHGAVLWGLAQGISKGRAAEVDEIQQLILVLFEDNDNADGGGDD